MTDYPKLKSRPKHIFIFEDADDGLTMIGEGFGYHRSVISAMVESPNVIQGLRDMANIIEKNEQFWKGIPD